MGLVRIIWSLQQLDRRTPDGSSLDWIIRQFTAILVIPLLLRWAVE
jgi:hypothetical protein